MTAQEVKPRSPFYRNGRFWRILILLFSTFVIVHDAVAPHSGYLERARDASWTLSQAFGRLTPGAFRDRLEERRLHCDYRWLFVCEALPPAKIAERNAEKLANFSDCIARHPDPAEQYCIPGLWDDFKDGFFQTVEFPDAALYLLRTSVGSGWLPAAMAIIFIALNVFLAISIARGTSILLLPFYVPISTGLASVLYWLLEHLFQWTALAVYGTFALLVGIAMAPESIAQACGRIYGAMEARRLMHEWHEWWQSIMGALKFFK